MRILIADRLRPFSHTPGSAFILPGSSLCFRVFPALIRVEDLSEHPNRHVTDIQLNVQGPVDQFTICQDLEKGFLHVWGQAANGFMRYKIHPDSDPKSFFIKVEKPQSNFLLGCTNDFVLKQEVDSLPLPITDQLSLGNNKAQDWDFIQRRGDFTEIFPLWFRLGQLLPIPFKDSHEGTLSLLDSCQKTIESKDITSIIPAFRKLWLAGFEKGLVPRLVDSDFQGFIIPELSPKVKSSPLQLITRGSQLIRSLFISGNDQKLSILPALPPEFHCGRVLNVRKGKFGVINLEWSKKTIRRMVLKCESTQELTFDFQKDLKRLRLRKNEVDRGKIIQCGAPISFESGQTYLFDCFER